MIHIVIPAGCGDGVALQVSYSRLSSHSYLASCAAFRWAITTEEKRPFSTTVVQVACVCVCVCTSEPRIALNALFKCQRSCTKNAKEKVKATLVVAVGCRKFAKFICENLLD